MLLIHTHTHTHTQIEALVMMVMRAKLNAPAKIHKVLCLLSWPGREQSEAIYPVRARLILNSIFPNALFWRGESDDIRFCLTNANANDFRCRHEGVQPWTNTTHEGCAVMCSANMAINEYILERASGCTNEDGARERQIQGSDRGADTQYWHSRMAAMMKMAHVSDRLSDPRAQSAPQAKRSESPGRKGVTTRPVYGIYVCICMHCHADVRAPQHSCAWYESARIVCSFSRCGKLLHPVPLLADSSYSWNSWWTEVYDTHIDRAFFLTML